MKEVSLATSGISISKRLQFTRFMEEYVQVREKMYLFNLPPTPLCSRPVGHWVASSPIGTCLNIIMIHSLHLALTEGIRTGWSNWPNFPTAQYLNMSSTPQHWTLSCVRLYLKIIKNTLHGCPCRARATFICSSQGGILKGNQQWESECVCTHHCKWRRGFSG